VLFAAERHARAIQERCWARRHVGASYTGQRWCRLAWEIQHAIHRDNLNWGLPINIPLQPDQELEQRLASLVLDVLIRAGLILAMAMLCYQVLPPFLTLMVWALILAVTLYPLHQAFASKIGSIR
jgi:hypothetical protein